MLRRHRVHRLVISLTAASIVALAPGEATAQLACSPGPLSAYLASAGVGCNLGGTIFSQFGSTQFTANADEIFLDPFTLQGPPGFTWLGFNVRFSPGTVYAADRAFGFSFWTNGVPIYGLQAQQQLGANANGFSALRTNVTGDGGVIRAIDRYRDVNGLLVADHRTCQLMGLQALNCINNIASWQGVQLFDSDNVYKVNVSSVLGMNGTPNNYSVALLVQSSSSTPEPATLLLLATGLSAAGAAVRRRRKA